MDVDVQTVSCSVLTCVRMVAAVGSVAMSVRVAVEAVSGVITVSVDPRSDVVNVSIGPGSVMVVVTSSFAAASVVVIVSSEHGTVVVTVSVDLLGEVVVTPTMMSIDNSSEVSMGRVVNADVVHPIWRVMF